MQHEKQVRSVGSAAGNLELLLREKNSALWWSQPNTTIDHTPRADHFEGDLKERLVELHRMSIAECDMRQFDVFLFRGADWGHYCDSGAMPLHVACGFRSERTCPNVEECAAFILDKLKTAADAFAADESLDLHLRAFRAATRDKPKRGIPSRIGTAFRVIASGSPFARRLAAALARIAAAILSARASSNDEQVGPAPCAGLSDKETSQYRSVRERLRARRYADIPDARGRSSLILAAGFGNLRVVRLLHEAHTADLDLGDNAVAEV